MKKKNVIILCIILALIAGVILWYHLPVNFVRLDPDEVLEIYAFSGLSGRGCHITDREDIAHIIDHFNSVKLRRDGISMFRMGYRVKVTIYLTNGEEADGWNNFIINGSKIRKDPFFYKAVEGRVDAAYIENLIKQYAEPLIDETRPMATEVQNESVGRDILDAPPAAS